MEKAVNRTKWFVIIGMVLSLLSFFTTMKGWSEIYPFYYWKLYSQPTGWSYSFDDLRVYAKNKKDTNWTRIKNEDRNTFKRDETLYFLRHIIARIEHPVSKEAYHKDVAKLKVFCAFLVPEYDRYKVVKETYNPKEIMKNLTKYDTTTVVKIP